MELFKVIITYFSNPFLTIEDDNLLFIPFCATLTLKNHLCISSYSITSNNLHSSFITIIYQLTRRPLPNIPLSINPLFYKNKPHSQLHNHSKESKLNSPLNIISLHVSGQPFRRHRRSIRPVIREARPMLAMRSGSGKRPDIRHGRKSIVHRHRGNCDVFAYVSVKWSCGIGIVLFFFFANKELFRLLRELDVIVAVGLEIFFCLI